MKRLFVVSAILVLAFLAGEAYAQCGSSPPTSQSCGNYTECRCESNSSCGADALQRTCHRTRYRTCTCDSSTGTWDCSAWGSCINPSCGGSSVRINCDTWELCQGNTGWGGCGQSCACEGNCLASPTNPKLYDGLGEISNTNVHLPIEMSWDSVSGAQSYWYRLWKIDPPTTTEWTEAEIEGKYTTWTTDTRVTPGASPCFLQLSATTSYSQATSTSWQVTPCCNADGTNCKDWTDVDSWFFELSIAPQLIYPEDPDWNSPFQKAEDVSIPTEIQWCSQQEAEYYKLWLRIIEGGVEECHPHMIDIYGGCLNLTIPANTSGTAGQSFSSFKDTYGTYFFNDAEYKWKVASCFRYEGQEYCGNCPGCYDWSQEWRFVATSTAAYDTLELISPADDPTGSNPVEVPTTLRWRDVIGINSYRYEVGGTSGVIDVNQVMLDLSLNTSYSWRVRPCSDFNGLNCDDWTDYWHFKTTGQAPVLVSPLNGALDVTIPVLFSWNNVSGAKSYRLRIEQGGTVTKETVIRNNQVSIDYPDLQMDTSYEWQVQTCANEDGTNCGSFSAKRQFQTFLLQPPSSPPISPADGADIDEVYAINFSWNPVLGARAYRCIIYDQNGDTALNEVVTNSSFERAPSAFPETGSYTWEVFSCLTRDCSVMSDSSTVNNGGNFWTFNLNLIAPPEARGGLVPCGRNFDNPDTPWNERDKCSIIHLFLLLRNILEFLLWKVATIFMVLLALFAGFIMYIAVGNSDVIFRVKDVAKTAILGYAIIFGSWTIINILLGLLGYKFGLFGHWWELPSPF